MTRIFVIATDTAGCWFYRLHLPLTHLDPHEFEVIWHPPQPDELAPGDIVIGQRLHGHNQAWLDMCADPKILAVYEIDDDIIDIDPQNTIPYSIFQPARDGTITNIAAANLITASTPKLAAKIARWNPHVVVLPNCADPAWLALPNLAEAHGDTVSVGWAGSPFHAQDWPGVGEALAIAAGKHPQLRWCMHGANYTGGLVHVDHVRHFDAMPRHLAALDFHIGLAPLMPTVGNASKSWAKLLEYGARGIPGIATAWGQYPEWFDLTPPWEEPPGVLIDTPLDIIDAIGVLCEHDIRARMGNAARQRAAQYTIDRHIHRWANTYRDALTQL